MSFSNTKDCAIDLMSLDSNNGLLNLCILDLISLEGLQVFPFETCFSYTTIILNQCFCNMPRYVFSKDH